MGLAQEPRFEILIPESKQTRCISVRDKSIGGMASFPLHYTQECRFMEKRLREILRFFVAPRREFAPAVRARPRTPFSINTSTSVLVPLTIVEHV